MSTSTWTVYEGVHCHGEIFLDGEWVRVSLDDVWVTQSDSGFIFQVSKNKRGRKIRLGLRLDGSFYDQFTYRSKRVYTRDESNTLTTEG